jgi:hypothetical protein
VKSQITLLTPFNQKCWAKFWKLYTTFFFLAAFLVWKYVHYMEA